MRGAPVCWNFLSLLPNQFWFGNISVQIISCSAGLALGLAVCSGKTHTLVPALSITWTQRC